MLKLTLLCGCCLILSGCALAVGEGLAIGAAAGEAAALGAGAEGVAALGTEEAAAGLGRGAMSGTGGAVGRIAVSPVLGSEASGSLGRALSEVAAGRSELTINTTGQIVSRGANIATLRGAALFSNEQLVGHLDEGLLYPAGSNVPIGRLRGMIPQSGVQLELASGSTVSSIRPILVDVLQLYKGRYKIRLADGSTAWIAATALMLALTSSEKDTVCSNQYGRGVLVRTSGEVVPFDTCQDQGEVFILSSGDESVVLSSKDVKGISYDAVTRGLAVTA